KLPTFVDIRKVHENWSIFCFHGIFFHKNSKKFVYYNENMYTNSKFQTHFSRKLQRFRRCRKNKKCSIFHELSEYQQKLGNFFPTGLFSFHPYRLLNALEITETVSLIGRPLPSSITFVLDEGWIT